MTCAPAIRTVGAEVAAVDVPRLSFRDRGMAPGMRALPEECPVALTYNGSTQAVMMASPSDLEDFALGFSLSEDIAASPDDILDVTVLSCAGGYEARVWLAEEATARLAARRRRQAGPVGCGLCGIESIEEAMRACKPVAEGARPVTQSLIMAARSALEASQTGYRRSQAFHAAALWHPESGLVAIREDVGRHNALDKLIGAVARSSVDLCSTIAILTSRVSVDLVQKISRLGTPILVAMSAPTALAVEAAAAAGLTLVGVARGDGFEVYTHSERILEAPQTVPIRPEPLRG